MIKKTKFDLFRRLNRGGEYANAQEVRTCSMVLASPEFTENLRNFANSETFLKVFRVNDEQKKIQENIELAIRMVVHTYTDFPTGGDVQEFLDKSILYIIENYDWSEVYDKIQWVLDTLDELYGEEALVPPKDIRDKIKRRFSLRALEVICVGLARNKTRIAKLEDQRGFINEKIEQFWYSEEAVRMSGAGMRGSTRIQTTVSFGEDLFKP